MAFDYLAGLAANLVTTATITASSEDANYDADNVGIGWPAQPFKFNAAALDDTLDFDFASVQQPTLVSVHGHNIDSGITSITVLSDDNSSFTSPVTEATITSPASPTFFNLIASPTSHRYWRLRFNGTNGSPIEIGEVVIGVLQRLTGTHLISWSYDEEMPQSRQTGKDVTQVFAVNLSDYQQRHVNLSFFAETYAERNEIRDMLVDTKFGEEPLIIIPDPSDEIIIHGRVSKRITWERVPVSSGTAFRTSITVEEDPFWVALP